MLQAVHYSILHLQINVRDVMEMVPLNATNVMEVVKYSGWDDWGRTFKNHLLQELAGALKNR